MIKDLLPWKKSKETEVPVRRSDDALSDLHNRMNSLFDSFFDDFDNASWMPSGLSKAFSELSPNIEMSESDDAIEISAELPGLDADDIDVSIYGSILTIKGEKKSEKEDKTKNYHIMERHYGSFSRSMRIPVENLDLDKIESKFKKGVLNLTLPKTPEAKSGKKKIQITG